MYVCVVVENRFLVTLFWRQNGANHLNPINKMGNFEKDAVIKIDIL